MAYNYHWSLEHIKTSFSEIDLKDLLDDAILFNPMISKKDTSSASGEIPEDARKSIMEGLQKRRELMKDHG